MSNLPIPKFWTWKLVRKQKNEKVGLKTEWATIKIKFGFGVLLNVAVKLKNSLKITGLILKNIEIKLHIKKYYGKSLDNIMLLYNCLKALYYAKNIKKQRWLKNLGWV